jgi:deoxyribodipyrimidine photo-lyase
LTDNPAVLAAASKLGNVIPLYIWNPSELGSWTTGAASRWWLHQSLKQLDIDLQKYGASLIIRTGSYLDVLKDIIKETNAGSVFCNRRFEPIAREDDAYIEASLRLDGINVVTYNSNLLFDPEHIRNKEGNPFRVFTPFWKNCCSNFELIGSAPRPNAINLPKKQVKSVPLDALKLEPEIDWASGMRELWTPGERGAQMQLQRFINGALMNYATGRDRPDREGVSMISPHLHFGEISPRQVFNAIRGLNVKDGQRQSVDTYLRELGWREFAYHILFHFPKTTDHPLREEFNHFPWSKQTDALKRWQKGQTGFPIVDAGMRQLWQTGWMHNRVRMIVASFLTKDLLISWTEGAKWFWDTLVDADLASNTLGWQWASGCGADAAPYFRIFNPELQGEKFDPDGAYVARWVPELAKLPAHLIHKPWKASPSELTAAGVDLGRTYPQPIVNHSLARQRALQALSQMRELTKN